MELVFGVKAISDESNTEWEFSYVGGNSALNCMNNAYMEKLVNGFGNTLKDTTYRVSIPYTTATKNQVFKTRDEAFGFINNFIRRMS
jgi:hypothetical protein